MLKKENLLRSWGKAVQGKTTLLNILSTIDDLTKVNFLFMVKIFMKCLKLKELNFRKENIGFIFQNFNLLDTLTVKENIILPLKLAGKIIDEEDFKQIIKDLEIDDL